jgi:SNF2 family DNA or RNA helicase
MDFVTPAWDHQKKAVAFSFQHRDVALLWDVGTGKSGAAINILRGRYATHKRLLRTVILAPPVVLKNWQREFKLHSRINEKDIIVIRGTGQKRIDQLKEITNEQQPKIILLNYEALLNKEVFELLSGYSPEVLVCDEAHRVKNFKSKRAGLVAKLSEKTLHNYILTGTPILNSLLDLFQQFKILDRGETFGKNFYAFRGMYFEDENARWASRPGHFPKFVPRPTTYQDLQKRIYRKSLRALKSECLDLPPLVKTVREVEMSDAQVKAYKEMKNDFLTFVNNERNAGKPEAVVAQLAVTKALRLQQIVSGFVNTEEDTEFMFDKVPRLEALKELLEELTPTAKVIVWASFKANYRMIRDLCADRGFGYVELTGETPLKEKEKNIDLFNNDPGIRVLIGNQSSGGIGVNLTSASYSIFYSKNFSLEQDIQAEGRNYRGGSEVHEKVTRIDLLTPDSIDGLINEALSKKQNISDLVLQWGDRL